MIPQASIDREKARRHLINFAKYRNKKFKNLWYHELIAEKLEQTLDPDPSKRLKRLIITLPPGHGKSELVSREFPAFAHGKHPHLRILAGSYARSLSSDFCRDVQKIMRSPEYSELFPNTIIKATREDDEEKIPGLEQPKADSSSHEVYKTGGYYKSGGVSGGFTGKRGDILLLDDPFKNEEEALSKAKREMVWRFYDSTFSTRVADDDSVIIIVMTRWHEDDLVGRLLELQKNDGEADQWDVVHIEAIKETEYDYDPREIGEPLWAEKFPLSFLEKRKKRGPRSFSALYQGRPTSPAGAIFKREFVQFYKLRDLPPRFDKSVISVDCTFKESTDSDYVAMLAMGRKGADVYVLPHMVHERMDFPKTKAAFGTFIRNFPNIRRKIVEAKANGQAIIDSFKRVVAGIIPYVPQESKEARAQAMADYWEAKNIWLPDPSECPWVYEFIEELCSFPKAPNDDFVDAFVQGLLDLLGKMGGELTEHDLESSQSDEMNKILNGEY